MNTKIIIGADLVPTKSNYSLFRKGDTGTLIGADLENILYGADFSIFNLEVPLTDENNPIVKCGPNLMAPTNTMTGLKKINPHFFTLANNHILDQGESGLLSTIKCLENSGIDYSGVGANLEQAKKPYIKTIKGNKIGVYCCAEHEFSIATDTKAGVNPFDPLESLDHVSNLKKECDYVIVLYHGGKEHYRYPSPNLQKTCRKLVERGADIVVCQHSHCVGCKEEWENGTIVYGQGNFLFDDCDNEFWNSSLLLVLDIQNGVKVEYIPIIKKNNCVEIAPEMEKNKIFNSFMERSNCIQSTDFVKEEYAKLALNEYDRYMNMLQGTRFSGLIFRIFNKLSGYRLAKYIIRKNYDMTEYAKILNVLECEVHRECFVEAIKLMSSNGLK